MKRFIAVVALLAGVVALADTDLPGKFRRWTEAQALTRAAPTVVTEGLPLVDVAGFRILVCPAANQALSGACTEKLWLWDNDIAAWVRSTTLDRSFSVTGLGNGVCWGSDDIPTVAGSGRVLAASSGCTVTGGTLTVSIKSRVRMGQ